MNKTILAVAMLLLVCAPALNAYTIPDNSQLNRKQLLLQLQARQSQIDSLNALLRGLEENLARKDSLIGRLGGHVGASSAQYPGPESREYSADETDSLINLWFERQRDAMISGDISESSDMDSVSFSSSVPDEVLVERLRRMNPYFTIPFNRTVRNYMVLYAEKARERLAYLVGISYYYMPIFEEAFERYGLPLELKYMSIVESGLNPVARSRAGAKGIWQFMYGTAKSYGLKITSFEDERMDVVKSADAAARFLRDAYDTFGDWNLAICSYNCGIGNVQKAIRRSGSRQFWDIYPYLPRETRGYVPAFVGAMYAMTYYREYGIVPEESGMPAVVDTFTINRNLHFKQVSELTGLSLELLRKLNPQYLHDIVPGNEGPHTLIIPQNFSAGFIAVEDDSLYTFKAQELISEKIMKDISVNGGGTEIVHRVKSGDCLSTIARRYRVSVSQLRKWNHLKSDNLRIGQRIYIYR